MLRLLIVDDGIAAVADLTAADRTGDGELDIPRSADDNSIRLPRGAHQPKSEKPVPETAQLTPRRVLGRFRKRDSRRNHSA